MVTVAEAQQRVICNIGQITKKDLSALRRAAKAGTIEQWRGYWHPIPGAPIGLGPLKTCFGPVGSKAYFGGLKW